jgi:hypothetical protein
MNLTASRAARDVARAKWRRKGVLDPWVKVRSVVVQFEPMAGGV